MTPMTQMTIVLLSFTVGALIYLGGSSWWLARHRQSPRVEKISMPPVKPVAPPSEYAVRVALFEIREHLSLPETATPFAIVTAVEQLVREVKFWEKRNGF